MNGHRYAVVQSGGAGNTELVHVKDFFATQGIAHAIHIIAGEADSPHRVAGDSDRDRPGHHLIVSRLCGTDESTGGDQSRRAEQKLLHASAMQFEGVRYTALL